MHKNTHYMLPSPPLNRQPFPPFLSTDSSFRFRFRFFIHQVLQQGKCLESGKHTNNNTDIHQLATHFLPSPQSSSVHSSQQIAVPSLPLNRQHFPPFLSTDSTSLPSSQQTALPSLPLNRQQFPPFFSTDSSSFPSSQQTAVPSHPLDRLQFQSITKHVSRQLSVVVCFFVFFFFLPPPPPPPPFFFVCLFTLFVVCFIFVFPFL